MSEMALLKEIQLELTKHGCRALRVNVGSGWIGNAIRQSDGSVYIKGARRFTTGLPDGFPDLLVICPQGHVIFMELKTANGRPSDVQEHFHEFLEKMGQHICVCRSVGDAVKEIEKYGF